MYELKHSMQMKSLRRDQEKEHANTVMFLQIFSNKITLIELFYTNW